MHLILSPVKEEAGRRPSKNLRISGMIVFQTGLCGALSGVTSGVCPLISLSSFHFTAPPPTMLHSAEGTLIFCSVGFPRKISVNQNVLRLKTDQKAVGKWKSRKVSKLA